MRDSMIFYRSFYEAIKDLPLENQGEIYNAVFSYGLDFKEPNLNGISKVVWTLIKPQVDANIRKYNNGTKEKKKQNRSKTEAKQKQNRSKAEANVNDNVNDNDNQNDKENDNKSLVDKKSTTKAKTDSAKFFVECKELYFKFVKAKYNIEPIFTSKDGISLSKLLNLLEKRAIDKNPSVNYDLEFCLKTFTYVLNTAYQVEFIKNNFTIPILISQFNQILIQSTKNN